MNIIKNVDGVTEYNTGGLYVEGFNDDTNMFELTFYYTGDVSFWDTGALQNEVDFFTTIETMDEIGELFDRAITAQLENLWEEFNVEGNWDAYGVEELDGTVGGINRDYLWGDAEFGLGITSIYVGLSYDDVVDWLISEGVTFGEEFYNVA